MSYIIFMKVHDNISNRPYYFTPRNVYGASPATLKDGQYFLLPPNTTKKNIHSMIEQLFINKLFKKNMPYKDIYTLNKQTNLNEKKTYVISDTYWNGVLYKTTKKAGVKALDEGIQDGSVGAYEIRVDITTTLPGAKLKDKLLSGCDYHKRVINSILSDMKINMNKKYFKNTVGGKKRTRHNRKRNITRKRKITSSIKQKGGLHKRKTYRRCVRLY
jgi:hypothetical protein